MYCRELESAWGRVLVNMVEVSQHHRFLRDQRKYDRCKMLTRRMDTVQLELLSLIAFERS
jgi:hypothetical protein